MKLFIVFACLVSFVLCHEILYTPGYTSYYTSPGLAYARHTAAVLPLAYTRLIQPASQSHVYHSVETPNSYQQQYRSDYKPLTYGYLF
ncbi:uncharacterized protein LOC115762817 [Drosophila novamexicana]|uniref:uncharacterized protein LOC115762817 n=1 Tax=Drosophila novamexicana TaxID=47314 RepID=UPI0011E5F432|nr:uncharacterized protein LOC115762817 [Drosophila novamexicana]